MTNMTKFPITSKGFKALQDELHRLKYEERPKIIQEISTAREFGDLKENAEYHAAKEKQELNEGKIIELEDKVRRAEIIDLAALNGDSVTFGASVLLLDCDTEKKVQYQIVGEYEADISKNLISISSPVAKALISKKVGDIIEVITPRGVKIYELLEVKYIDF